MFVILVTPKVEISLTKLFLVAVNGIFNLIKAKTILNGACGIVKALFRLKLLRGLAAW